MNIDEIAAHLQRYGGSTTLREWPRRVLWGIAPTGPIHFGYFLAIAMLRVFAAHGAEIVLLIANRHGVLDSEKTKLSEVDQCTEKYVSDLLAVGIPPEWLVYTDDVYARPDYFRDYLYATASMCLQDVIACGTTTLRSGKSIRKTVADVNYAATQIFDTLALEVDCVMCGNDEAPIYRYGLDHLRFAGHNDIASVYLPMAPGRRMAEMHASDPKENKLLLLSSADEIRCAYAESPMLHRFVTECVLPLLRDSLDQQHPADAAETHELLRRA